MVKKDTYLVLLKGFILLAPLPFGCVGPVFSPLFYMMMLLLAFLGPGMNRPLEAPEGDADAGVPGRWIRRSYWGYLLYIVFQAIPLPLFLVRLLSPARVEMLDTLRDALPAFLPLSTVPWETVWYGVKFLSVTLFFLAILRISLEKKDIIGLFNTMILSAALQGVFGLLKYLTGNRYFFLFFHPLEEGGEVMRLTGTLGNENHFAFLLEMVFPLVLALFLLKIRFVSSSGGWRHWLITLFDADKKTLGYALVTAVLGVSILLTGSRAGVITLGLSFLIFAQMSFYLKQTGSFKKRLWVIFIGISVLAVLGGFNHTMDRFTRTRFEENSRLVRWGATLNMTGDYPVLGTGLGTYRYAFYLYDSPRSTQWSTHAHNDYLELLSEGGAAGLLLFGFLAAHLFLWVYRMWARREHPVIKMVGIGVLTSLFAVVFHSLFDFSLRIPSNLLYGVLILVLGIKMMAYQKNRGGAA